MNPIETFKKIKLLYKLISLKNRLNSYGPKSELFGAHIDNKEEYIHFDEYAYYYIPIVPSYKNNYNLYLFCNKKYIIFRKDETSDFNHKDPKNYIIIKKTNSIRINRKPDNDINDKLNFLYEDSHYYYDLYDYYNEDYDLYKAVEYILNKKHDYIARSICFILGCIITYFTPILYNYIISIIISK